MLVTVEAYRRITGDESTAEWAASARIEEAIEALEDRLDRPLAEAERTESLYPTRDGRLWPKATPITDAGDYERDGEALISSGPWPWTGFGDTPSSVVVTYTGGFVERAANPGATNRLPDYMERDIAWAAHELEHRATNSTIPAGATAASVGDVTVSFGSGGAPGTSDPLTGIWSKRTLGWRYAPIGTRA